MLRDPLVVKNLLTPFWVKNNCKTRKLLRNHLTYQPLLASHVCVGVCVCVFVCESECVEERRCGIVTLKSPKKHISEVKKTHVPLSSYLSLNEHSISQKHDKLNLEACISHNYYLASITIQIMLYHNQISAKIK